MKRTSEAAWCEDTSRWKINVQKNGTRRSFYSSLKGRKGKHEAEAKADTWLASGTTDMRFPEAWEIFLKDQKERTGTSNYRKHEVEGRLRLLPTLGNARLSKITPNDWQRCIDAGAAAGLSRRSCKNTAGTISAFIHYAQRSRWEVNAVLQGDLRIPNSSAPAKKKTILQPEHIRTLFSDDRIVKRGQLVPAHYIYAWRFYVATGLRRGELAGLRREDIDGSVLTINRSINCNGEETYGKNDNARRTIVLSGIAMQVLDDQRKHLLELGIVSPWVFPDECGGRSNPTSIYYQWRFYCASHDFYTTIHELRHTFVSVNKTMPVELMKSFVGHSTSMDTYGVYGHDVDGDAQRTAAIVEGAFESILNAK